jgi:hypothetical protein
MTQTIEYVVKVNATQAQAAVAEVEKRFGGVDTVVARVDKSIIALERDMKDLNAAIAAGGPNVGHYQQELERLAGTVGMGGGGGKTGGGKSLGMAALEGSRAVEDLQYGLAGVVNNIPNLVMALGGGMGLTAAISLGAVAANQLYKRSSEMVDEFGRADRESKALRSSIAQLSNTMSESLAKSLDKTKGLVEDMRRELRLFGLESGEAAIAQAEFEQMRTLTLMENNKLQAEQRKSRIAEMEAEAKAMETNKASRVRGRDEQGRAVGVFQQENYNELFERIQIEKSLLGLNESRIKQAKQTADTQANELVQLAEMNAELQLRLKWKKEEDDANKEYTKNAESMAKARYDLHVAMLEDEDKALREVAESRRKDEEARLKLQYDMHVAMMDDEDKALREVAEARRKDQQKAEREANRDRERDHKRTVDAMKKAEQEFSDFAVGMASMTTDQLAGSLTDYLTMKAEGEEHAEKKAIASFLSATGKQLVATGVKGVFEGAIISANPLTPGAGAGMMALGGAAIVAGMAMAGGGAAVGASIPTDKGGDKQSTRDPGASPRSSGGGGGGGPLIVNVAYGAGGPLPEDIAREIHKVTSSGNRRRGAA